jgi:hypothetical protein
MKSTNLLPSSTSVHRSSIARSSYRAVVLRSIPGAANSAGSGIAARALGIVDGRQQRRSALSPSLLTDTPVFHSQTGATPLRY